MLAYTCRLRTPILYTRVHMHILIGLLKAKSNLISATVIQLCHRESLCGYQNTLKQPWSKTCSCLTNPQNTHTHTNNPPQKITVRNEVNGNYGMSGNTLIFYAKTEAQEFPSFWCTSLNPHKTIVKWKQVIKQTLKLNTYNVLSIWTTPTYWVVTASIKLMMLPTL